MTWYPPWEISWSRYKRGYRRSRLMEKTVNNLPIPQKLKDEFLDKVLSGNYDRAAYKKVYLNRTQGLNLSKTKHPEDAGTGIFKDARGNYLIAKTKGLRSNMYRGRGYKVHYEYANNPGYRGPRHEGDVIAVYK